MKKHSLKSGLLAACAFGAMWLTVGLVPANAQSYSIDWSTIDGGGGQQLIRSYGVIFP
jgi:hypothetical protein